MKVLVVESNLMWSSRLAKSVKACGHEPVMANTVPASTDAPIVILNLGDLGDAAPETVTRLHNQGAVIVAHAGHKEKELHALGKAAGCDILATNGELTWKLEKILEKAGNMLETASVKDS